MCYAMFIAFLIDQIQFAISNYYKRLKELLKSKISIWEEIRTYFFTLKFTNWNELYQSILERVELKVQTRMARKQKTFCEYHIASRPYESLSGLLLDVDSGENHGYCT